MPFTSAALSARIYARVEANFGKLPKAARSAVKKFTDAVAEAVVAFLEEDVTTQVTVTTQLVVRDGGLQTVLTTSTTGGTGGTSPGAGTRAPTEPPLQPVTLSGTGTGTGTFR